MAQDTTRSAVVDLDAVSPGRQRVDAWVVRVADPVLTGISRHWLALMNSLAALLLLGAFAAPALQSAGVTQPAGVLYEIYSAFCHQWAFRSFFLFGSQAVYDQAQLQALDVDPYKFIGTADTGWKMAFCERDLAIFTGLLIFGLLYAARFRPVGMRGSGYFTYALLILPMALDGFTQLFGYRESSWLLRIGTGLVFGLASGWLMYPRFNLSFNKVLR
jgi:uncharacterized membrane protein